MKSYSIRLDIPNRETKIDEEDISQLIYKGLASKYIGEKSTVDMDRVLIDVIEIETKEEQINNQERNRRV
jgi:hypothetical protein